MPADKNEEVQTSTIVVKFIVQGGAIENIMPTNVTPEQFLYAAAMLQAQAQYMLEAQWNAAAQQQVRQNVESARIDQIAREVARGVS